MCSALVASSRPRCSGDFVLTFNEGVPRAGKSYDAVLTHILPALKKGRKVFARLDGLNHDAIAEYLKIPQDDVRTLLVLVDPDDVPNLPKLVESDSLVVIDECHKYYVQSMRALPSGVEDFFAEHGHHGMDILLISQWYKRLHTALRARVERKTVFQKLTAVGMKNSYLATYWHTTGPDKFEQVGKKRNKYDPAIFPLYHGFTPESDNTEVYEAGGMSVWSTVLPWFIVSVALLGIGGVAYGRYFFHHDAPKTKPKPVDKTAFASTGVPSAIPARPITGKPADPKKKAREAMPDEVAYVWGLQDKGRARLAGYIAAPDGQFFGVVEWRADKSRIEDSLTVAQLRSLGVTVERKRYGLLLSWGEGKQRQTIVATMWPLDEPNRYSRQDMQDIRERSPVVAQSMPSGVPSTDASQVASASFENRQTAKPYVPPQYQAWNSDPFASK